MSIITFNPHTPSIIVNCRVDSEKNPDNYYNTKMVIDTGATNTLISPAVLELLEYDTKIVHKTLRIICPDRVMLTPIVRIKRLWLGEEKIEDLDVICHSLPEEAKVRGLLGLDFLKFFNVAISFERGTIELKRFRKR